MHDLDFSFRQLRDFLAVAEELSFRKAAARLNSSQPPVTRSIQALERSLGIQLFNRTSRRVALTPDGESFLPDARGILHQVMQARARARAGALAQVIRQLRLGFLEPAGQAILPRVLASWHGAMPDVEISLVQDHSLGQERALKEGSIDLGIIRPPINLTGLSSRQIWTDEMVMAVPEGSAFADGRVSLTEMQARPFIAYLPERNAGYTQILQRSCTQAGFKPRIAHQVTNTALLMGLVAAGEGVALVSGHLAKYPRPGVAFVPFRSNPPRGRLDVAWRKNDPSPTTQALLRHMVTAVAQLQREQ